MIFDTVPLEIFPIVLFFISFFGMITSNNIIKSIVFILLMQTSVVMFWLIVGGAMGTMPPIGAYHPDPDMISDPLPQALMLTAIIIGISVTAINITMLNTLFRTYQTADWQTMEKLVQKDLESGKS